MSKLPPLPSRLHRAIVSLPEHLCTGESSIQDRIVFFEAPANEGRCAHLERLLASAWCIDTSDWGERGFIYNIDSAHDRLRKGSYADQNNGDLILFETGCGGDGPCAVGPDRVHYARAADVDLFVTPRIAARLAAALAQIESLYAAEPARRARRSEVPA